MIPPAEIIVWGSYSRVNLSVSNGDLALRRPFLYLESIYAITKSSFRMHLCLCELPDLHELRRHSGERSGAQQRVKSSSARGSQKPHRDLSGLVPCRIAQRNRRQERLVTFPRTHDVQGHAFG